MFCLYDVFEGDKIQTKKGIAQTERKTGTHTDTDRQTEETVGRYMNT